MIVCHCKVVNHRDIQGAVDDGARSVPEVSDICGVGTDCGGCLPVVAETIARHLDVPVETVHGIRPRVGAAA